MIELIEKINKNLYGVGEKINLLSSVKPKDVPEMQKEFFDNNCEINFDLSYDYRNYSEEKELLNETSQVIKELKSIDGTFLGKVCNKLSKELETIESVGTPRITETSLSLFKGFDQDLVNIAKEVYEKTSFSKPEERILNPSDFKRNLESDIEKIGLPWSVEIDDSLLALCQTDPNNRAFYVKGNGQRYSSDEIGMIKDHELSHCYTGENARNSFLSVASLALSANEDLSEALAINEERKHCKNDNRLRELCVRVLAVDTALNGEKCGLPAVYNVFRSSGMPENESFRSII